MEINNRVPLLIILLGVNALFYVFTKDVINFHYHIIIASTTLSSLALLMVFPKLKNKVGFFSKLNINSENLNIKDNIFLIHRSNDVVGLAVYVVDDIPYSYRDVSQDFLIQQVKSFTGFITAIRDDVSIVLLKRKVDQTSFMKDVERKIVNYKIMASADPANPQIMKKLSRLEKLYERMIKGEKPVGIKYYIIVKARASSERGLKKALEAKSNTVISSFKASLGLDIRKATSSETLEAVSLGVLKETKYNIVLESDVGFMVPISYVKRPKIPNKGIYLGLDIDYNTPVFYDFEKYLTKHVVVIGPTGRGKTTFLYTLAKRTIEEYEVPVWVFDLRGEFLSLGKSLPIFTIIDPEKSNINILHTWFTSPRIRAKQIVELVKSITTLTSKEEYLLYMALIKTYESMSSPTFENLVSTIAALSKDYGDKDVEFSLLTKIETIRSKIFFGKLHVFEFKKPIIFVLHKLPEEYRKLYTLALLQILNNYMLTLTPTNNIRYLVILDEAWRLMDTHSSKKIVKTLIKEGRGYGLAVALASQDISDFPKEILDNAGTLVVFGSNSRDYIESISKYMKLNETDKEKITWLKTGEALVRIVGDPRPLWVKISPEIIDTQKKQI